MDFYNNWQKKLVINEFELIGFSLGAFKTGLVILPYKICLDAGVISQYEPNNCTYTKPMAKSIYCTKFSK